MLLTNFFIIVFKMRVRHTSQYINFNIYFIYSKDDFEIEVKQNIQIFNLTTN